MATPIMHLVKVENYGGMIYHSTACKKKGYGRNCTKDAYHVTCKARRATKHFAKTLQEQL